MSVYSIYFFTEDYAGNKLKRFVAGVVESITGVRKFSAPGTWNDMFQNDIERLLCL